MHPKLKINEWEKIQRGVVKSIQHPPKPKEILPPWQIAIKHVRKQQAFNSAHLAGRIHEHAELYKPEGWNMKVRELKSDEKDEKKLILTDTEPFGAPNEYHEYKRLADFGSPFGKMRFISKDREYKFDGKETYKVANTLLVDSEHTFDVDAINIKDEADRIPRKYQVTLKRFVRKE